MLEYLKAHPVAFDSDEVRILTAAFDNAWRCIQASGARFDSEAHTEAARAILARHILAAAAQGERDQRRLCDGALVAFTQASRRNAPRDAEARAR